MSIDWFAILLDEIRCKQSREGEKKKYKPHREKLEKLVEKASHENNSLSV